MPYHIHHIKNDKQRTFLQEKRLDPITGEAFQVGDKVVFCKSCQSAFLKDSWDYLDARHCGQVETLADIPITKDISIKRRLDTLYFEQSYFAGCLLHFLLMLFLMIGAAFSLVIGLKLSAFIENRILSAIISVVFYFIIMFPITIGIVIGGRHLFNKINGYPFKMYSNGIKLIKAVYSITDRTKKKEVGKVLWLNEIERIVFKPKTSFYKDSSKVKIWVYLTNGKRVKLLCPRDVWSRKKLLLALAKFSQKIPLELHLKDKRDISYVNQLITIRAKYLKVITPELLSRF